MSTLAGGGLAPFPTLSDYTELQRQSTRAGENAQLLWISRLRQQAIHLCGNFERVTGSSHGLCRSR